MIAEEAKKDDVYQCYCYIDIDESNPEKDSCKLLSFSLAIMRL